MRFYWNLNPGGCSTQLDTEIFSRIAGGVRFTSQTVFSIHATPSYINIGPPGDVEIPEFSPTEATLLLMNINKHKLLQTYKMLLRNVSDPMVVVRKAWEKKLGELDDNDCKELCSASSRDSLSQNTVAARRRGRHLIFPCHMLIASIHLLRRRTFRELNPALPGDPLSQNTVVASRRDSHRISPHRALFVPIHLPRTLKELCSASPGDPLSQSTAAARKR
ncbi:hypothetical protein NDU88_004443 [Pleurodeles waltl]|uniref:Uncharacterized protein n=1 Tax=Pleurodeles waltl TaxID=8319 RepID=A0AAV7VIS0_PLEWA|nr:hypothetical protein NDU88_004443 [Pleurodeles waltl]